MELYGRNSGSDSDPPAEWDESGLEESMWRMSLSGQESYPERPGVSECVYYMRTGICGFGTRCRYNHPPDRAAAVAAARLVGGEYPERQGEPVCQYYLRTGTCKFGATCKFNHPRDAGGMLTNAPLNYYGYPLRPGENECSYYLKTGQCKFGITCKFHHPQPAGISTPAAAPVFYPTVHSPSVPMPEQAAGSSSGYGATRPPIVPGSYVPGAYGPVILSPGVVPMPNWSSYSAPLNPSLSPGAQPGGGVGSMYGVAAVAPVSHGPHLPSSGGQLSPSAKEHKLPERPGEPDCQYYMKTGNCKYDVSCRYHHPPDRGAFAAACVLGPLGLPLRPGALPCTFYMQNGYCKFGPSCKFDHPMEMMNYSPSEMPISPHLTVSSLPTMPPSSLSTDLQIDTETTTPPLLSNSRSTGEEDDEVSPSS